MRRRRAGGRSGIYETVVWKQEVGSALWGGRASGDSVVFGKHFRGHVQRSLHAGNQCEPTPYCTAAALGAVRESHTSIFSASWGVQNPESSCRLALGRGSGARRDAPRDPTARADGVPTGTEFGSIVIAEGQRQFVSSGTRCSTVKELKERVCGRPLTPECAECLSDSASPKRCDPRERADCKGNSVASATVSLRAEGCSVRLDVSVDGSSDTAGR